MKERILRGLVVALLLIIVLLPIYWMVAASLKSNLEITQQATLYPHAPSFDNYRRLFSEKQFGDYLTNSLVVTACSVALSLWSSERLPPMPSPASISASISSAPSDCRC